ncbi:hypothetical protein [Owenweeksia hongkongensis]|uniref:hypothetical protein n=1 Tax=Owenweeksia hongkongensis TaxID=253245 RepID=UPI003A938D58
MRYTDRLHEILDKTLERLKESAKTQFDNELRFAWRMIENETVFLYMIQRTIDKNPIYIDIAETLRKQEEAKRFETIEAQAAFSYSVIDHAVRRTLYPSGNRCFGFYYKIDSQIYIVDNFIKPLFNYLHDSIDSSGFVLYLLEKYKKRTEWFLKEGLLNKYQDANKSFEQILEDDLRLYLFDQGIDYPFSTPQSASGRADMVGLIDTDDPLVAEVKIIDREKGYGMDRIKSGFAQIEKYTNDYHKDFGYLVLYNMDDREVHFDLGTPNKVWPPRLELNSKVYYFVVVNLYPSEAASKQKKLKAITVTKDDLVDAAE